MRKLALLAGLVLSACTSGDGPDDVLAEPFATAADADALAARGRALFPADGLAFQWIETVWGYGAHRHFVATGDPASQAVYRDWITGNLDRFTREDPQQFTASDELSPAVLASTLAREDAEIDVSPLIDAAYDYLAWVPRTANGAVVHWGEPRFFAGNDEVWVDSLFMVGMFLLAEHQRTGERAPLEAVVAQYVAFSELCRDDATQLYRHSWDDGEQRHVPADATMWARGNGWVLVVGAELLAVLPANDPLRPSVEGPFKAHLQATLRYQADDGLFRTVLNDPRAPDDANYTETSASALIGYALTKAARAGVVPLAEAQPPLDALLVGLRSRMDEDQGALRLRGTSVGTNPGAYEYYVAVPALDDQLLGYGAALMWLAELDGLPRQE